MVIFKRVLCTFLRNHDHDIYSNDDSGGSEHYDPDDAIAAANDDDADDDDADDDDRDRCLPRLYRLPIVVQASKLAGGTAGQLPTSSSSLQAT